VSYSPADRTTPQLLRDWAAIMRELRARRIIRTDNNPVGDIAEEIVARYLGGKRGGFAQAGWDVLAPDGQRVQVKAMRLTATAQRNGLSPIRDRDYDYDYVVVVIMKEDFVVSEGLKIPRDVVEELFPHRAHVNGRVITMTRRLRADPRVTALDLSAAATTLE
jgi:hypothetical protein